MDFTVKSSYDDITLSAAAKIPQSPKALLIIAHGMAEHKERYFGLMEFLYDRGIASVIHDHRGHGKSILSAEDSGYFYSGGAYAAVDDMLTVLQYTKARFNIDKNIPTVLLGHSMGSLIARCFLKKYDSETDAVILSGPPCKNPAVGIALFLTRLLTLIKDDRHRSRFIDKLAFASYSKRFGGTYGDFCWLSSSPERTAEYINNPLCGEVFTLNGFKALFTLMSKTYSKKGWQLKNPSVPICLMAGSDDPCIGNEKSFLQQADFLSSIGYTNITTKLYSGLRHEILLEPDGAAEVMDNIAEVINSLCPQ